LFQQELLHEEGKMAEVGPVGQEKGDPSSMTVTEEKEGSKVGPISQPQKEYLGCGYL
jgi:hypothetical protein